MGQNRGAGGGELTSPAEKQVNIADVIIEVLVSTESNLNLS
jgi:hypothetical protein